MLSEIITETTFLLYCVHIDYKILKCKSESLIKSLQKAFPTVSKKLSVCDLMLTCKRKIPDPVTTFVHDGERALSSVCFKIQWTRT